LELYKIFAKNNLLVFLGHVLISIQGIILMPIIIKTVGATVYGGYILLASLVGFVFGISSFGTGFNRSRLLPSAQDRVTRQELFYPQFLFQCVSLSILSCVLILIYPFLDDILLKNEITFSIWLIAPYYISYLFYSQATDYYKYTNRIGFFNFATISYPYINIAIIILLCVIRYDLTVNMLFIAQIIAGILVSVPLVFKMIHEIGIEVIIYNYQELTEDIKFGFPLLLGYIVDIILSFSDRYVIAAMLSVTAVGYYNPGYGLGSLIIFLPKVFGVVLQPLLCKACDSGREEEARTMLDYTLKAFFLLAIPFVVGCGVLSKPLLILFANIEVAENAYLVTPIVALGALFYGINSILSNVLFVRMKTAVIFKMNAFAAILNLVLNFILLYVYKNILIAAVTTFFSYFAVFIFIRRIVIADWLVNFHLETIAKSIGASLVMAGLLILISSQLGTNAYRAIYIFFEIGFGMVIYFVSLFAFKTFYPKELNYLKKVFS
jgi:O-antigen/teichoic acid export membrane protein